MGEGCGGDGEMIGMEMGDRGRTRPGRGWGRGEDGDGARMGMGEECGGDGEMIGMEMGDRDRTGPGRGWGWGEMLAIGQEGPGCCIYLLSGLFDAL